ncbi:MAG: hypothetical protein ACLFVT_02335 [Syntrophobacteria bacterium]
MLSLAWSPGGAVEYGQLSKSGRYWSGHRVVESGSKEYGRISDHYRIGPGKENGVKETLLRTCVAPSGEFMYGIHKPQYTAFNLRETDCIATLGQSPEQEPIDNAVNFPENSVRVNSSSWVFEVPNAFPFMGATFIIKSEADRTAGGCNPFARKARHPTDRPLTESRTDQDEPDLENRSRASLLALAKISTDPELLARLAERSCRFAYDEESRLPSGLIYERTPNGQLRPAIVDQHLFDLVSNNPFLPDVYKRRMVLIPGVQGKSPVVGEYTEEKTHIWEYLRENSYIPWGHFAANMAHDAVRYTISSLTEADMIGLRHLYYQRIYVQLAAELRLGVQGKRRSLLKDELENLRLSIVRALKQRRKDAELPFNGTIWGQNFGSDLSPSGYRLNASHQQVHQQFALVPSSMPAFTQGHNETSATTMSTYIQGDLVAEFSRAFREKTNRKFFDTYLEALANNTRLDGRGERESDLSVYQDENVIAFVPKAQRSHGEVQIMTKRKCGNIIETDAKTRASLDRTILLVMKALEALGAEMMTAFEVSKRLDNPDPDQRLLYCFLPRHPFSPGSFSEFQQRWISGHYPEDYARTCRDQIQKILANENRAG